MTKSYTSDTTVPREKISSKSLKNTKLRPRTGKSKFERVLSQRQATDLIAVVSMVGPTADGDMDGKSAVIGDGRSMETESGRTEVVGEGGGDLGEFTAVVNRRTMRKLMREREATRQIRCGDGDRKLFRVSIRERIDNEDGTWTGSPFAAGCRLAVCQNLRINCRV